MAGVDSLVIKELMGHESLATTAIYVDVPLTQRTNAISMLGFWVSAESCRAARRRDALAAQ